MNIWSSHVSKSQSCSACVFCFVAFELSGVHKRVLLHVANDRRASDRQAADSLTWKTNRASRAQPNMRAKRTFSTVALGVSVRASASGTSRILRGPYLPLCRSANCQHPPVLGPEHDLKCARILLRNRADESSDTTQWTPLTEPPGNRTCASAAAKHRLRLGI